VLLTTACAIDFTFPNYHAFVDPHIAGNPEFYSDSIAFPSEGEFFVLAGHPINRDGRPPDPNAPNGLAHAQRIGDVVEARRLGDNDLALLYVPAFHTFECYSLGLQHPSQDVEAVVQNATSIFGSAFFLYCEKCNAKIRHTNFSRPYAQMAVE